MAGVFRKRWRARPRRFVVLGVAAAGDQTVTAPTATFEFDAVTATAVGIGTISVTAPTATFLLDAVTATATGIGTISVTGPTATFLFDAVTATATGIGTTSITAPTATFLFDAVTATATGIGTISVTAPTATFLFDAVTATAQDTLASVTAPTATIEFDAVTATAVGIGTISVTAPTATFILDAVTATATGIGTISVTAPTATFLFDAVTATAVGGADTITAPTATILFDAVTATATGIGTTSVTAPTATFLLDAVTATAVGIGTVSVTAPTSTFLFDAVSVFVTDTSVPEIIFADRTPAETAVANAALLCLGERRIESLSENSLVANVILERFDEVRDEMLRIIPWNFADKRIALAADTETPAFEFRYQYTLPSDWLRLNEVQSEFRWRVEGRKILTSQGAPLRIVYTRQVTNPNEMHSGFRALWAAALALDIAEAITGSTQKGELAMEKFKRELRQTATVDGQENGTQEAASLIGTWEAHRGETRDR